MLPDALVQKADRPTITLDPADQGDCGPAVPHPHPGRHPRLPDRDELAGRRRPPALGGPPQRRPQRRVGRRPAARPGPRLRPLPAGRGTAPVAHDRELASCTREERVAEVSGPLPADRVTASAVVEAAKKGLEYRPARRRQDLGAGPQGAAAGARGHPGRRRQPGAGGAGSLLNLAPGLRRYELVVVAGGVPDPLLYPGPPSARFAASCRARRRRCSSTWPTASRCRPSTSSAAWSRCRRTTRAGVRQPRGDRRAVRGPRLQGAQAAGRRPTWR